MTTDLKGQALLDAYRKRLRILYGDEVADKSELDYLRGWYYITLAKRYPDGSISASFAWGKQADWAVRAKELAHLIEVLDERIEQKEFRSCE